VLTPAQREAMDRLGQIVLLHERDGQHQVFYASPEMEASRLAPTIQALGWQSEGGAAFTVTLPLPAGQLRRAPEPAQLGSPDLIQA
jgi:hypothetical protein